MNLPYVCPAAVGFLDESASPSYSCCLAPSCFPVLLLGQACVCVSVHVCVRAWGAHVRMVRVVARMLLGVCARACACVCGAHGARYAMSAHTVPGVVSRHSGAAERFFLEMPMSLDLYVGRMLSFAPALIQPPGGRVLPRAPHGRWSLWGNACPWLYCT